MPYIIAPHTSGPEPRSAEPIRRADHRQLRPFTSMFDPDDPGPPDATTAARGPIGMNFKPGTIFSHSRLASFENCPKQFEFRYIQKIPSETEGVEAFVGKRVHEILERLYIFVGRGQVPGIQKVVDRYHKLWEETYDGKRVRIVREGTPLSFYRQLGEQCLRSYYMKHYPFDEGETLGIEKRVLFPLDDAGEYRMQGIIDRISRAPDGTIEVHDYKTGARVPAQRIIDQDRQLALYQIGLSKQYGSETPFRLVWHYVAKNRTCVSTRSAEELRALRKTTMQRIDEIQHATEFPPKKIALCNWCEYKERCPLWATPERLEELAAEDEAKRVAADEEKAANEAQLGLL
jgi:putative RecB family exonuclease